MENGKPDFTVSMANQEGFVKRVRTVLEGKSARAFADLAGIPPTTFNKIVNGTSEPTRPTLVAIARAANVSLDWLLTGEGPMRPDAPASQLASRIDEALYGRLIDALTKVYKECGVRIPPIVLGELAAGMAADLIAAYDTHEGRVAAIDALMQRQRRELRAHPAETGSSKRSA